MNKKLLAEILCILSVILLSISVFSIQKITVEEGDLVNLKVIASDANQDLLVYEFTPPLNESGQWQTNYDSAGEYLVNVSVLDGTVKTIKPVLIVVKDKNRIPVIEKIKDIIANETDKIILKPIVKDADNDKIELFFSEPFDKNGVWKTNYGDAGDYEVKITASDGKSTVEEKVKITIKKKNRPPKIISFLPATESVEVDENSNIKFSINAVDDDGGVVSYSWYLDNKKVSDEQKYVYLPDYESAGEHIISAYASDGKDFDKKSWKVVVNDVNRAPIFTFVPKEIVSKEGELVVLNFNATDPDGDEIYYTISEPFGEDKQWQTGYDDSGVYFVDVKISDKKLSSSARIKVIVNEVDRVPFFEKINDIEVEEGNEVSFTLNAEDPDNDVITFSANNLPDGASLAGNKFYYKPGYDVIRRQDNAVNRLLNNLRLEKLYPDTKDFNIKFIAKGRNASTEQTVKIRVKNHNLAPELANLSDITVNEGETVEIKPVATDYDNDRLYFTISGKGKDGVWKTGYDDAGVYTYNITVSDGKLTDSKEIKVFVRNVNRKPVFSRIEKISAKEGEAISIKPSVFDADGDKIEIIVENPPKNSSFKEGVFKWTLPYDIANMQNPEESIIITFIAKEQGRNESVKTDVIIDVLNTNRPPVIKNSTPNFKELYEGDSKIFFIDAYDPDNDSLSYTWKFGMLDSIDGKNVLKRTFTSAGSKTVEVIVSDGKDSVSKKWEFAVKEKPVKKPAVKTAAKTTATAAKPAAQAVKTTAPAQTPPPKPVSAPAPTTQPKQYKMDVYVVG